MQFSNRPVICSFFVLFMFLLAFSEPSHAATLTWTGGGTDNLASNPANWTANVIPRYADGVVFDNTSPKDCTWDIDETLSSLSVTPDYTGTITQTVTLKIATPISAAPSATTDPVTNKNGTSATLNGTVNPNGLLETSVYFEWGTSTSYGNNTSIQTIPAGVNNIAVSANITGLSINTTYHYRVVAVNPAGTTYGVNMVFTTPPIAITITSPSDGANIFRPDVLVKGTLATTGEFETGLTVNGMVAMVFNNEFVINHVPLADGTNAITVTATDMAGNMATTAISVTAVTNSSYIRLNANPDSGVSPLTVNFTASTSIPNVVTTYKIDYDGDGTDDYTGSTFTDLSHTYSSPGSYYAKLTVVDSSDISCTDTIAIVVVNGDTLDGSLRNIWNSMKAKLTNNDAVGASGYYSFTSKDKYLSTFSTLAGHLPEIAANMQDISLNYIGSDVAEYRIIRNETINGQPTDVMYFIYFVKDEDGLWKIQGF